MDALQLNYPISVNVSDPAAVGPPRFPLGNTLWQDDGHCDLFEIRVSMRVSVLKVAHERRAWSALLDQCTQFIAFAVPCFVVVLATLNALLTGGFVPVHKEREADFDTERILQSNT